MLKNNKIMFNKSMLIIKMLLINVIKIFKI